MAEPGFALARCRRAPLVAPVRSYAHRAIEVAIVPPTRRPVRMGAREWRTLRYDAEYGNQGRPARRQPAVAAICAANRTAKMPNRPVRRDHPPTPAPRLDGHANGGHFNATPGIRQSGAARPEQPAVAGVPRAIREPRRAEPARTEPSRAGAGPFRARSFGSRPVSADRFGRPGRRLPVRPRPIGVCRAEDKEFRKERRFRRDVVPPRPTNS